MILKSFLASEANQRVKTSKLTPWLYRVAYSYFLFINKAVWLLRFSSISWDPRFSMKIAVSFFINRTIK